MEEETSVEVEATTEESQPEAKPEETEASQDISSEGTENTADVEPEAPKKSRANERIRELVAQKKELEAQLAQAPETNIEGVDETGIDPNRFAESVLKQAETKADQRYGYNRAIDEARQKFPEVAENELVGTRATALMSEGYNPIQAAEIATLEWRDQVDKVKTKSAQRQSAGEKMRQGATMAQAGKSNKATGGSFTRSEIAKMSPAEYTKNAKQIQSQLEKYGADSFEE
jgi:hypothetical protein